jgi:hypothetical protein
LTGLLLPAMTNDYIDKCWYFAAARRELDRVDTVRRASVAGEGLALVLTAEDTGYYCNVFGQHLDEKAELEYV